MSETIPAPPKESIPSTLHTQHEPSQKQEQIIEGDKEKTTTIVSSQNYTACLSEVFPSFAGVATQKEYHKACLSSLLFSILIFITLIFIFQFPNDVLVDVSEVLLLAFTIMFNWDNFRVTVKRVHAFGWSYTYCSVIPNIIVSFLSFVFITKFCFEGFIIMIVLGGIYNTILFLICFSCNASIDKSLDAKKIEKDNKLDENYDTSLHQAAYKGQIEVVKQLIDAGANVNKIDTRGRTPLDYAVSMRRSEVVKLLVKAGAKK